MSKKLVAIDPSINDLGFACFEIVTKKLIHYELMHPEKEEREDFKNKSFSLYKKIRWYIDQENVVVVVCEVPEYWDKAGFVARESGAIFKLCFICGMIYTLQTDYKIDIITPTPKEWKGQLSKNVMCNRLRQHYEKIVDLSKLNHNIVDAIGLGHWALFGRV